MCIPKLADALDPGYEGTIRFVQGRPGHGKTSLVWYHASVWSKVIKQSRRKSCVVYATAETMAEHLTLMQASSHASINGKPISVSFRDIMQLKLNDEQRRAIDDWNMAERPGLPLFVVGMSFSRKNNVMDITPNRIGDAVEAIKEHYGLEPEMVCVDYLQILKPNAATTVRNSDNRVAIVGENSSSLKQWAQKTHSFWEVAVQAGRQVDDVDPPFPDQGDAQWASQIEQDADSGISITRPWKYLMRGGKNKLVSLLDGLGLDTNLGDPEAKKIMQRAAIITTWKQKTYDVGNTLIKFDPRFNEIDEWEKTIAVPDDARDLHF
jgi:replicative DNA helicase